MSKVLKTAAIVVGAIALVATGIGAVAGAGIALGLSAGTLATIATVASIASVAAGVLTIGASLTAKKPPGATVTGSQTSFSANPDDGLPLILGRTGTAGKISFRKGFDSRDAGDNDRQSFVSTLSIGPIDAIEGQTVDRAPVSYTATGAAIGAFAGFMWSMTQLGALPEAQALTFGAGAGTPPAWTAAHKMSGKAAASWTLRFDTTGKQFQAGVPAPMWVARGARCYDPTKDSTYPGGSGPHRIADPADTAAYDAASDTWTWTEDPYLLGLHWAHGYWQRDRTNPASTYQRVMGIGAPWAMIDVAAYVEGRNVATANAWKCGGVVYSTDGKWDTMKRILQAGMGEPLAMGARISCLVNAPKVSLATITRDDLRGTVSVSATQPRRERINTITPRYRLEANNWQTLPGPPITVPEYVAMDRGKRSKLVDYHLIQDPNQVATAVRYDIENAREFGPITLPLRLLWMGYKPGDCVTVDLPEEGVGLIGQPVLLLNRDIGASTGIVTMTARSETAAKHPFALGQTTTPPATPALSGPPLVPVPGALDWSLDVLDADPTVVSPTLIISGLVKPNVDGVVFEYREFDGGGPWSVSGSDAATVTHREITGLKANTAYEVAVSYSLRGSVGNRRIIGPVTTPVNPLDAVVDAIDGFREDLIEIQTIATGKNRTFLRPTAPSADESVEGDLWYDTATGNQLYRRGPGTGSVEVGGSRVTIGGAGILLPPWLPASDVRFETNRVAIEAAQARLTAILSDGILSVDEKRQFAREWQAAQASYSALDAKAAGFGGVTALRTALTTAYGQLAASIAAIAPAYDTFAVDSPVDRATVEARWAGFYTTFAALDVAVTAQTVIIQWSVSGLGGWHTDYAAGDKWQRQSVDGGLTFGPAVKAVGEDGGDGAAGLNNATIFLFRRATSTPTVPTSSLTYTFATTALAGDLAGWSRTAPAGTDPLYVTAATASSSAATDAIAGSEWAAPVVQARDGGAGAAGYSQATVYLYQRTPSAPARPGNTLTYTFATGALSGSIDNGWLATIPAGTDPLWVTVASAYANTATDTIATAEWSAPVIQARDGVRGINVATVLLYQRAATAPSVPASVTTYTFASGVLTGTLGSWSQSVPAGTNPIWVTLATAAANADTDTIGSGEWAAPVVQARDGGQGAAGYSQATVYLYQRATAAPARPSNILTYTFATATLTGTIDNGWSTTIPGGSNPLWVTVASAYANTATDAIAAGEWSAPVIQAQDGSPGGPGAAGLNVSPVLLYQRGTAAPAVPSTATTFTFATAVLSGSLAGWTQTVPAGSTPLWITTATAAANVATDTIAASEWAVPRQIAANGINVAPVTLYQRANATPAVPTAVLTYTFATSAISGSLNGWSTSIPAGTADLYVTQATALGADAATTDTIATGEWSAPVIQAQTGQRTSFVFQRAATQPATPTATVTPPPGWSDAPPVQTTPPLPLWQTSADFRDVTRLSSWATPIKLIASSLTDLDPVAAGVLAGKGRQFRQSTVPASSVAQENDLWIDTANGDALYVRGPGTGVVMVAGNRVTIGGNGIVAAPWFRVGNPDAVKAAADAAAARAVAEAAVADGLLSPDEKRDLATERATIVGERDGLVARAAAQGVSSVTYQAAYSNLIGYLDGLALGDRTTNTVINATTHTDRLSTYYTARTSLLSMIGDLTAANQHSLGDVADMTVAADYTGAINGGQLPQQRSLRRYLGQSDVSAQAAVTVSVTSGLTATINNTAGSEQRGTVTVTGLTVASGTITIASTYAGVALYKEFRVIREDAPPPAGGGTAGTGGAASGNASTSSFIAPGSNAVHMVLATFAPVTTGSGGKVVVSAPLSYGSQSQGAINDSSEEIETYLAVKAQYQVGSGAWTDAPGGEVTGSGAVAYFQATVPKGIKNYPGSVGYTATVTGLGSGSTITVRLLGRMVQGTSVESVTGTASVTPS